MKLQFLMVGYDIWGAPLVRIITAPWPTQVSVGTHPIGLFVCTWVGDPQPIITQETNLSF